ncbi:transcription factor S [Candidatus Woesearchaeota archaeon]|nr:MAG: transcription elongation factor [archaeon GW2011_AR4]MBS3129374.1 transcription factor S [Candidatus Woesearchaeota archaeon]HIH38415.1 transcription factor S [Candidatus Woesearchaeota archaeon]HIH48127.1 transcription factor S [Candidatus Woesearchaeota archaeon]HIJ03428.1 transcription factor S [Candidatus Woesearchaeota archaeon]
MFCPKDGSLLVPKKDAKGKSVMTCPTCGHKKTGDKKIVLGEMKQKDDGRKFDVVEENDDHLPLVDTECPKCGHRKAHFWMIQTRAADEPATKFMKCEKCKHTWRDYK